MVVSVRSAMVSRFCVPQEVVFGKQFQVTM
jgi:hypothetical protein